MIALKYTILLFCIIFVRSEIHENFPEGKSSGPCPDAIQALRDELTGLKEKVERQDKEIHLLRQEVTQKPKQRGTLQAHSNFPQIKEKTLRRRLLLNSPLNNSNSEGSSTKIAFYANRVTDNSNLALHQALAFGDAITNVGNCYHHSTGTFIPNTSGIYVFDVQILLCSPGHELRTELVVEGATKAAHYTGDSTHCSNGGGMTVLHVNTGDSVWVRVRSSDGGNGIAWESSFSGFLLYAD